MSTFARPVQRVFARFIAFGLTYGLMFCCVNSISAQQLGFEGVDTSAGIQVTSVTPGGPMTQMTNPAYPGFNTAEPGDLIVALNGMQTPNLATLQNALRTLVPANGQFNVSIRNVRNGLVENWSVQPLMGNPPRGGGPDGGVNTGMTYELGIRGSLSPEGLVVVSVTQGGPATQMQNPSTGQQGYMETNDVIVAINGLPIRTPDDYRNAMRGLASTGGRAALQIRDVNTGQIVEWVASANVVGGIGPGVDPGGDPGGGVVIPGTGQIHIVVCGMLDGVIDASVNTSTSRVLSIIRSQVEETRIASNRSLIGASCTAENIMNTLDNLNSAQGDAIFVYFIGHGAFDPSVGGHFFDFPQNQMDLPRREISNRLAEKGARLTVFISEACHQDGSAQFLAMGGGAAPVQRAFEKLMMNFSGVVDVNSSSQGQLGWGNSQGGYFSVQLLDLLWEDPPNPNWPDLVNTAGQRANQAYSEMRQNQLDKFNSDPSLLNDPDNARVQSALASQQEMTPAIFRMDVR